MPPVDILIIGNKKFISKYIFLIFRDQPDLKLIQQEQTSPRITHENAACSSVSVCVQTSLPDLTNSASDITCHNCQKTDRAKILQKNMTTTGYHLLFICDCPLGVVRCLWFKIKDWFFGAHSIKIYTSYFYPLPGLLEKRGFLSVSV